MYKYAFVHTHTHTERERESARRERLTFSSDLKVVGLVHRHGACKVEDIVIGMFSEILSVWLDLAGTFVELL